jgi:transposase
MPTQRRFGQEVDRNARRGPNISPADCLRIITKRELSVIVKELAAEFGRSEGAIKYTIRIYAKRGITQEQPCSSRPPILLLHQKKIIYRKIRATLKIECSELSQVAVLVNPDRTTSKPPSRSTLYRLMKRRGLTNFRCKKRPKLNCGHAIRRLQFCREYRPFE